MSVTVVLAQLAFVPATLASFRWLGPRRGMFAAMLGGWLFLPSFGSGGTFPLLNTKGMFVPAIVLGVSLLVDGARWRTFRLQTLDLGMAFFCVVPFVSAISNDLGAYEGTSAVFEALMVWGAPYLLGRVYVRDLTAARDLALALIIGALVYVPFCLWEIRMSPQLHRIVYGFATFEFSQAVRSDGFRPSVFMQHGLMAALYMGTATLAAYWLWRTRAVRKLFGIQFKWVVAGLGIMMILFKSSGALLLLAAGLALLEGAKRTRAAILVLALLAVPPAYCFARISGWNGESLVQLSHDFINPDRAESLNYRIRQEKQLVAKALIQPAFGWGRWGGNHVYDEHGRRVSVTDSYWIIIFGVSGYVGLLAHIFAMSLPAFLFLRRFPVRQWADPRLAPAAALAVGLLLSNLDNLLNAMIMPVFPLLAGALAMLSMLPRQARSAAVVRVPVRRTAARPPIAQGHAALRSPSP